MKDNSCKKIRRRQKRICMKSCGFCEKFIKKPSGNPPSQGKCPKDWMFWNDECWMLSKDSMTWDA